MDDRRGDVHGRHGSLDLTVGEGVARVTVDAEQRHDVARGRLVDVFHVVRVHPNQTADLDLLAAALVVDELTLGQGALVDPQVGQLTVPALFQLERQTDEVLGGVAGHDELDFLVVLVEANRLVHDVGRAGQVARDGVEQGLNALVLVGRAAEDGIRDRSPSRGLGDVYKRQSASEPDGRP